MYIIKNCPFCGSDRVEAYEKTSVGARGFVKFSSYVKCHNCRARGPAFSSSPRQAGGLREQAIYEWNKVERRAPGEG